MVQITALVAGGASQAITLIQLSVSDSEQQPDSMSDKPASGGNGLFVAFRSEATNLVSNDSNDYPDVFRRDVVARGTAHVGNQVEDPINMVMPQGLSTLNWNGLTTLGLGR